MTPANAAAPPAAKTARERPRVRRWVIGIAVIVVVAVAAVIVARALAPHAAAVADVPVQAVQRQNIRVTIEATGTVEAIDLVEVKSKASGQILKMPVEAGSHVRAGDLLAEIDKVDVQNQYDQARAALVAAQAKADISAAQLRRADTLVAQGLLAAEQHEVTALDFANAQAALVAARTNLDTARQRRADATVRAPITGTVLEQLVTAGQVIASATQSVSGGTALLRMADLGRIRMRALVAETDIGSVRAGQVATVTIDAFPNRTFRGEVMKIEPQAVVQQSVTMFPALVSIENEEGLLLPGMNGQVSMQVGERDSVLAVPVEALRAVREVPAIALALGLPADAMVDEVNRQVAARASADTTSGVPRATADPGAQRRTGGRNATTTAGTSRQGRSQAQVVFVRTAAGLAPRVVHVGLTNFDYAQILDGLNLGDEVALLSVAELQAKRQADQSQLRARMSSGMPGVGSTSSGGGASRTSTPSAGGR